MKKKTWIHDMLCLKEWFRGILDFKKMNELSNQVWIRGVRLFGFGSGRLRVRYPTDMCTLKKSGTRKNSLPEKISDTRINSGSQKESNTRKNIKSFLNKQRSWLLEFNKKQKIAIKSLLWNSILLGYPTFCGYSILLRYSIFLKYANFFQVHVPFPVPTPTRNKVGFESGTWPFRVPAHL